MVDSTPLSTSSWPAPAKINLFLHVVGRRADGYHLLQTVFQFLDFCDELDFVCRPDGQIRRTTELPGVLADDDLVVRAARQLQTATHCPLGVDITVVKKLPMGGGLGGGSSNAATVLVALNALWQTRLDTSELARIGLALGADVPVFIAGQAAWAEGIGEQLTPIEVPMPHYLVISPGCQVPTAAVFRAPELTRNTPIRTIHGLSLAECRNDCEPVTRRLFPEVGRVLDWLGQFAAARMTGTGACVFAPFTERAAAETAGLKVPKPWSWFIATGRNRSPLLDKLAAYSEQRASN